jgi:hypothetical protein
MSRAQAFLGDGTPNTRATFQSAICRIICHWAQGCADGPDHHGIMNTTSTCMYTTPIPSELGALVLSHYGSSAVHDSETVSGVDNGNLSGDGV